MACFKEDTNRFGTCKQLYNLMETIIKVSNIEFMLSLHEAKVIHANKYSEAHGGAFHLPVSSTLYTDVVFRLRETNEDIKTYIKNADLPIYNEQEVMVICSGSTVLGYVDLKTKLYYYVTSDFCYKLGIKIPTLWILVVAILGAVIVLFIARHENFLLMLIPFGLGFIFYLTRKRILNHRIRKAIDNFLS